MTILEFLKTRNIDEIVDEFVRERESGETLDKTPLSVLFRNVTEYQFCIDHECVNYYEDDYSVSCDLGCFCGDAGSCPFKFNKADALRNALLSEFNTEKPEVHK